MAIPGLTLTDTNTGNSVTFEETAASTDGARAVILHRICTPGKQVPEHQHVYQSETFEVIEGTLTVYSNGRTKTLAVGEKITFAPGTVHNHWNAGKETLVYRHTTEPALDFEYLIENLMGLSQDLKIRNGKVSLLQALVAQRYMESKAFLAFPPVPVQKGLAFLLAPIARLLGYRAVYAKYSGFEK
jgi:quercetin dioxygenase-like cupin family protein